MERYIYKQVIEDLNDKMVFIAGPRQCGKTTLAKDITKKLKGHFLNYDIDADRSLILAREIPPTHMLALDEIHKYPRWRNYLKSLYDANKEEMKILVTGSARLDFYRKGGDSLQGRYHLLRLHPLSTAELKISTEKDFKTLLDLGGFPEPYFSGSLTKAKRWSREYRTRVIRQDLASLEQIKDVALLEEMSYRLPEIVSGPLSINSLREDLNVAHETVTRWLNLLENLYMIFRISPFGSPRIKALKKEQKHYHMDWTLVESPGARFENMVACHLLKWCHWMTDTEGDEYNLSYYRDREKREVDFVVTKNRKPYWFIECKLSEKEISDGLKYLHRKFPEVPAYQLLLDKRFDFKNAEGIRVMPAWSFLKGLV